jgi:spermidine/putrescine transport system ATP-binding protein
MKQAVIQLQGVGKQFHDVWAVKDIHLDIQPGEFLTILGPSGCGKTTILRLISGLETCDSGDVFINDKNHTHIPASQRDVNTVFQSYALFPHMTVFENIAFGLTIRKMGKAVIREKVAEALSMVKLSGLEHRRIFQLSGGQQQRVAIARAIVNEPLILLLDEPLSALDYRLRKDMRIELKQLHRKLGITFIFVTHDQEEALTMSDRVVVMNHGRIEQDGTPKDIYEKPVNMFVANFVGESNILDGTVITTGQGRMDVTISGVNMNLANSRGFSKGDRVKVLLRPEDMKVERRGQEPCEPPLLAGKVQDLIYKGTTVDLLIQLENGQMVFATEFFNEDAADIYYAPGEEVCLSWIDGWETVLPDE